MTDKKFYANSQPVYELSGNTMTYYFKTGKVKAQGGLENDQMEGEWKFYRETGQLWQVGNFKSGKKNGPWVRYDREGNPEYSETFLDDKLLKK